MCTARATARSERASSSASSPRGVGAASIISARSASPWPRGLRRRDGEALGVPYEEHVADAAKRGVSAAEIRALLRLVAFDTGFPAAEAATARLAEISGPGETEPLAEEWLRPGESPLPEWVRAPLRELDPWFHD